MHCCYCCFHPPQVVDADGFFHTGDIGEFTKEGLLKIIDRKKNIFKLSQGKALKGLPSASICIASGCWQTHQPVIATQSVLLGFGILLPHSLPATTPATVVRHAGEYVAVEYLEAEFGKCDLVEQIWLYGSSFESCLVAVVVPVKDKLMKWAEQQAELSGKNYKQVCQSKVATEHVLSQLTATGMVWGRSVVAVGHQYCHAGLSCAEG